ncbi:polyphenol oxidase family protein [Desertihabitans brevis]|nr:polyphenol oxidase family protein [Desertihabitans brevis]
MFAATEVRDGVGVAFTDRSGGVTQGTMGSLNLGRSNLDPDGVRENFDRVRSALDVHTVVALGQVHTPDVVQVTPELVAGWGEHGHLGSSLPGQSRLPVADAMVATDAIGTGVALAIRVADCLPVVLTDPAAGVVGAAHAGRVGLLAGVLTNTVDAMRRAGAGRISATIGPHVCGACYEVPTEMQDAAARQHPRIRATTSWGTPSLDLGAAARDQLEQQGVTVHSLGRCTRTDEELHSHRRDGAQSGRQAALVWFA